MQFNLKASNVQQFWSPPKYRISDEEKCLSLAKEFPLATAITSHETLAIALSPVLFDEDGLFIHFNRANPIVDHIAAGAPLSLLFSGPASFVSARWYGTQSAPTWCYRAVLAYSDQIQVIEEQEIVATLLLKLARENEQQVGSYVSELSKEYVDQWLDQIILVKLGSVTWEGVQRLDQFREVAERWRVAHGLCGLGSQYQEIGRAMIQELDFEDSKSENFGG